eukprot:TRINITY_DN11534_c0_g1_i1.p1 TRINITY_DN11534_c0_g1~~TRINITY_DN11534_c0_g1_i1.p1  ORF type:complete len:566 (+),score=104.14 TRINITY_DN11534_c0_g1_i1:126-1823(+)
MMRLLAPLVLATVAHSWKTHHLPVGSRAVVKVHHGGRLRLGHPGSGTQPSDRAFISPTTAIEHEFTISILNVVVVAMLAVLSFCSVIAYFLDVDSGAKGAVAADTVRTVLSPTRMSVRTSSGAPDDKQGSAKLQDMRGTAGTVDDGTNSLSSAAFVIVMCADLCPHGMLPLAYGMRETGYVPGFTILLLFYGLSVFTMWLIAKTAQLTGEKDFSAQWRTVVGGRLAWLPNAVVVVSCFAASVASLCMISDIFVEVLPALPWPFGGMARAAFLFVLTVFALIPLCLLRQLSAFSFSSTVAMASVLYTLLAMVMRYADGEYAPGGKFWVELALQDPKMEPDKPNQSKHLFSFGVNSFVFLNTLSYSFCCHFNGNRYYRELRDHTPSKMLVCTAAAMGVLTVVVMVTSFVGFSTFGGHSSGDILSSYSKDDKVMNVARLCIGVSMVAEFPFGFLAMREALEELLKQVFPTYGPELDIVWKQNVLSIVLVVLMASLSARCTDLPLVVGLVGSVFGYIVIVSLPCFLYGSALQREPDARSRSREIWCYLLAAFAGLALGLSGGIYSAATL